MIDENVFRGTVMPFVEFKKHKHGKTNTTTKGLPSNLVNRLNMQIYIAAGNQFRCVPYSDDKDP